MGAGFSISGKIESGSVQAGDKVQLVPVGETGTVKGRRGISLIEVVLMD